MDADKEELHVVGLSFSGPDVSYKLYTVFVVGEKDYPIMKRGKIIFFSDLGLTSLALRQAAIKIRKLDPPLKEVSLMCNVSRAIRLIKTGSIDRTSTILNCLNTLFDLIAATDIRINKKNKRMLYGLADHLTFSRSFSKYFENNNIDRDVLVGTVTASFNSIFKKSNVMTGSNMEFKPVLYRL